MRVLPRVNEEINEEWICDKTRYAVRRPACVSASTSPMSAPAASLQPATWAEAFAAVAAKMKAAAPDTHRRHRRRPAATPKSSKAAKDLFTGPGRQEPRLPARTAFGLGYGPRESWLFNSTIDGHRERRRWCCWSGPTPRLEAAAAERPPPQAVGQPASPASA